MTLKYLVRLNSHFSRITRLLHCVTTHLEVLESRGNLMGTDKWPPQMYADIHLGAVPSIHVVPSHVASSKLTSRVVSSKISSRKFL